MLADESVGSAQRSLENVAGKEARAFKGGEERRKRKERGGRSENRGGGGG